MVQKILFSVDSRWRDLPAYVLLKRVIEKKYGHKVYLLPMGSERYYIPFLKPDIVIFNHLFEKKKEELARQLKGKDIAVCILPTEGAPFTEAPQKVMAGIYHDYSSVDLHFTWNQNIKELMVKHNVLQEDKIKVIGVPRFDLYRHPMNSVFMPKGSLLKKYRLNTSYPVVTLATNFTTAKLAKLSTKHVVQTAENLRINRITHINDRMKWYEKEYLTREEVLSIFGRLAAYFPHVNFMLKHHPMEDVRFYKRFMKQLERKGIKNIALISKEYIWDVLNATDILIQRACTTATEAWSLNMPTIQLQLSDHYYSAEHLQTNDVARSFDETVEVIKDYLKGKEIPTDILNNRQKTLERMFFSMDGRSAERCAMHLDAFLRNRKTGSSLRASLGDVFRLMVYESKIFLRNSFYALPPVFTTLHNKLGYVDKRVRKKDIRFWEKKLRVIVDDYILLK
jgi:surface carbohydrate biosynthesis protein